MNPVTIRPFESKDRDRVRTIALDTADLGFCPDENLPFRDAVADFLARYYTDHEPESAWIADNDGIAVGYILGSIHPRRHHSIMRSSIIPSAAFRAVREGALWNPEAWRLFRTAISMLGTNPGSGTLAGYPAHLHINIDANFRSGGIGKRLVGTFEEYAANMGITGIHARVRGSNSRAGKFFSSLGYAPIFESRPVTIRNACAADITFTIVTYAKKIKSR